MGKRTEKREKRVDVGQRISDEEESQMKNKFSTTTKEKKTLLLCVCAVALINVKQKQLSDKIFKTSISLSRFSLFVFSVG